MGKIIRNGIQYSSDGTSEAPSLNELTNVNITSPNEGETLIYNSTSSKWVNGQGGGKQTALTQAEYDALVQAGTVDPTMEYFITDGIPASVKHNYSTDEQVVGTWVDGKTLYEKTVKLLKSDFIKENDNFFWASARTISSVMDTIVKKDGFCKLTNFGTLNFGSTTYIANVYTSNYISFIDYYNGIALTGNSTHLNDDDGWYVYFTCRYTKSST